MLTLPGSEPLNAFISAVLAESSGKSPLSVMLLPLRVIDSGAKDNLGAPDLLDGVTAGSAPNAPLVERGRSNAAWPIAAISNGITTRPISQGRPSDRRAEPGAVWPTRPAKGTIAPSSARQPRFGSAGDMQPTQSAAWQPLISGTLERWVMATNQPTATP